MLVDFSRVSPGFGGTWSWFEGSFRNCHCYHLLSALNIFWYGPSITETEWLTRLVPTDTLVPQARGTFVSQESRCDFWVPLGETWLGLVQCTIRDVTCIFSMHHSGMHYLIKEIWWWWSRVVSNAEHSVPLDEKRSNSVQRWVFHSLFISSL